MNVISLKAFLAAFLFTISLVITQQASAKVYIYEGELSRVGKSYQDLFSIGDTFNLEIDINGSPNTFYNHSYQGYQFYERYLDIDVKNIEVSFDNDISIFATAIKDAEILAYSYGQFARYNSNFDILGAYFSDVTIPDVHGSMISISGSTVPITDLKFDNFMLSQDSFQIGIYHPNPYVQSYIGYSYLEANLNLVNIVPEPSSYALLLAGLGLIGVINFRMRS